MGTSNILMILNQDRVLGFMKKIIYIIYDEFNGIKKLRITNLRK